MFRLARLGRMVIAVCYNKLQAAVAAYRDLLSCVPHGRRMAKELRPCHTFLIRSRVI